MSWEHYITHDDITDNVVKLFITKDDDSLDGYFAEADDKLNDLAQMIGVQTESIDVDAEGQIVPFLCKRFLIAYLCMRVCQDKASTNNVETSPDLDKYYIKYNLYKNELAELQKEITPEVLTGTVNSISDRGSEQTNYLFRS
jgi:hypothetical protein